MGALRPLSRGTLCFFAILHAIVLLTAASAHALPLVEQGQARVVLVTADEPSPVAGYAAEELAQHIEKATGVALAIVGESQTPVEGRYHVYIGVTEAATAQGIRPEGRLPDALLLRTVGHYFAGWCERYGKEHPEWFMMRADGQRRPEPDARDADDQSPSPQSHVAMCVSKTGELSPDKPKGSWIKRKAKSGCETVEITRKPSKLKPRSAVVLGHPTRSVPSRNA